MSLYVWLIQAAENKKEPESVRVTFVWTSLSGM